MMDGKEMVVIPRHAKTIAIIKDIAQKKENASVSMDSVELVVKSLTVQKHAVVMENV